MKPNKTSSNKTNNNNSEKPKCHTLRTVVITAVLTIIGIIILSLFLAPSEDKLGNVAVIPVNNLIATESSSGVFGDSSIASSDIVKLIGKAEKNPLIKAIVIEIDSPGGTPVGSAEVAEAVKKAKKSKPVVALIREIGTSGAYWVASASDHIVAHPLSITGSIGVAGSYIEYSGIMEKYGIGYEELKAGEFKETGTPFKKLSDKEKELLQQKIDLLYNYFIDEIAKNRNLPRAKVAEIATGMYYYGIEAKDLGLVDELGNRDTVTEYLKTTLNTENISYTEYTVQKGFFESLAGMVSQQSFFLGKGIGSALLSAANKPVPTLT